MRRREFLRIMAGATAAWPVAAHGQQPSRSYRIGVLSVSQRTVEVNVALIDELQKLGFVEGKNLVVEDQGFGKRAEEFPPIAAQFAAAKVDAIVATSGAPAIRAAQGATKSIPIIGIADDMVLEGHVRSVTNHGGNVTGISILAAQLDGKRQELLMELLPNARRMAIVYDTAVQLPAQVTELEAGTRSRNVELSVFPVQKLEDIAPALESAKAAAAAAVNFLASPLFSPTRKSNFAKALALGLPATHHWPEGARDGAFVAYGPSQVGVFRQLASPVAKVLRGENPGDVPIEQPTRIELAVNLRVAKQLGITVPETFLLRADDVIE
jgi:putative ABC transport system substrate-binding protein